MQSSNIKHDKQSLATRKKSRICFSHLNFEHLSNYKTGGEEQGANFHNRVI